MGHAMRLVAVAEELARRGYTPWFASRSLAGAEQRVRDAGYPTIPLTGPPGEEIRTIQNLVSADKPDAPGRPFRFLALDHYMAEASEWLRDARRLSRRRLVMDDRRSRRLDCEVVVNPALGIRRSDYQGLVAAAARLLLGPRYAPIRGALRHELTRAHDRRFDSVRTVLIAMGGTGTSDAARISIAAVREALPNADIHLLQSTTAGRSTLGPAPGVQAHLDLDDTALGSILLDCDLAVGAAGISAYERCLAGLPSVTIQIADNQASMMRGLNEAGAAIAAGTLADVSQAGLVEIVRSLAADPARRAELSVQSRTMIDGRGVERIANELEGVRFRRPGRDDIRLLWQWSNDPETRMNSLSREPIPWAVHERWFESRVDDPNTLLLIGYNGAGSLGQVRFELQGDTAEVSIATDPAHRGTVGSVMLNAALRRLRRNHRSVTVSARVRPDNIASCRMFESAGFRLAGERGETLHYVLDLRFNTTIRGTK